MTVDDMLWTDVIKNIIIDDNLTFLEFGVASGNTLTTLLKGLYQKNIIPKKVIGFDSFEGLPEEEENTSKHGDWNVGAFNIVDEMKKNTLISTKPDNVKDAVDILKNRFSIYKDLDISFIKGFYSETLRESYDIKPACFIHIDCDLYISSIQVLDFLARHKLFAKDCLVRYDDWTVDGHQMFTSGESKAHKEICEKYNLNFELIGYNGSCATLFRYKGSNV